MSSSPAKAIRTKGATTTTTRPSSAPRYRCTSGCTTVGKKPSTTKIKIINSNTKQRINNNNNEASHHRGTADLLSVVSTLDSHWKVLEIEVQEIKQDIENCKTFNKKYTTDAWDDSIKILRKLKHEKEAQIRDIQLQMELFNLHIDKGRDLCQRLASSQPLEYSNPALGSSVLPSEEYGTATATATIRVVSPILANSPAFKNNNNN